jgi:hypothetical protein
MNTQRTWRGEVWRRWRRWRTARNQQYARSSMLPNGSYLSDSEQLSRPNAEQQEVGGAEREEVEMVESEVGAEDGSREQKHELMTYQRKRWAVWNRRTLSASARRGRGKAGSSPRDFTQKQTGHDECDRGLKDVDTAGFMSNMAVAELN